MIYHSDGPKETGKIAFNLAAKTKSGPASLKLQRASIIALEGELGAGKTTFVQAFIKAMGVKAKIKSPTFNIIKKYKVPNKNKFIFHIDCYRLKDHKEAILLGFEDIFKEPDCFVLIEWPERISKILPKKMIRVHIDHIASSKRKIMIKK